MIMAIKIWSLVCKNGDIINFEIEEWSKLTIKQSICKLNNHHLFIPWLYRPKVGHQCANVEYHTFWYWRMIKINYKIWSPLSMLGFWISMLPPWQVEGDLNWVTPPRCVTLWSRVFFSILWCKWTCNHP